MNKKIIFLDVDGTLTQPSGGVSQKVQGAIRKARENGHYVFLCTGRSKTGIKDLIPIGLDGFICSAGGYIEIDGKKVYESFLSDENIQEARDIFERNHVLFNLEGTYHTYQDEAMSQVFMKGESSKEIKNSEMERLMREQKDTFNIRSLKEYDDNPVPIHKICFVALQDTDLEEPRQLLSDQYVFVVHEIFSHDTVNGEIIIKGTNKGEAIKRVVEILGLSMKDTIAFGDSMNDLEMMKECEYSVVMENGSQELKKYATTICESVGDDGVYHEMKRLGLLD